MCVCVCVCVSVRLSVYGMHTFAIIHLNTQELHSHSMVTPWVPCMGCEEQVGSVKRTIPFFCKGAGTQTNQPGGLTDGDAILHIYHS